MSSVVFFSNTYVCSPVMAEMQRCSCPAGLWWVEAERWAESPAAGTQSAGTTSGQTDRSPSAAAAAGRDSWIWRGEKKRGCTMETFVMIRDLRLEVG